ncbi:MAG: TetR/AcrR family transcriptional regulator [Verrucomicrobia bacterium]|nr:TetR/AcrR family transcriptional regulator [Verrucomicrobiota bacterium]
MPASAASESAPLPPGRKRKGAGHERREEILSAAKRLFAEHGYEKTTIRGVAAEIGISSTALYVYFPDKHAILNEICARTFAELTQTCEIIRASPGDAFGNLRRAVGGYIRFGLEHPHEYLLTFNGPYDAPSLPELEAETNDPGYRAFKSFRLLVEDVIAARPAETRDADSLAQCLWAGMHGLVSLVLAKPGFPWVSRDELIGSHVALLCGGILHPAPLSQEGSPPSA